MTADQHLAHLVALATRRPTDTDHSHAEWKRFAWDKAKRMTLYPELAELPRLLAEAMQGKGTSTGTAEPKSSP